MNTELVTLQLPASLYEKLQTIAIAENTDVVDAIAQFVAKLHQTRQEIFEAEYAHLYR